MTTDNKYHYICLSVEQKEILQAEATAQGVSMSRLITTALLGKKRLGLKEPLERSPMTLSAGIRLSPEQLTQLNAKAEKSGKPRAEWERSRLFST